MAVGRGSLKRLNAAAKMEMTKINETETVLKAANKDDESPKETFAGIGTQENVKRTVSKIVCTLPDYLL